MLPTPRVQVRTKAGISSWEGGEHRQDRGQYGKIRSPTVLLRRPLCFPLAPPSLPFLTVCPQPFPILISCPLQPFLPSLYPSFSPRPPDQLAHGDGEVRCQILYSGRRGFPAETSPSPSPFSEGELGRGSEYRGSCPGVTPLLSLTFTSV